MLRSPSAMLCSPYAGETENKANSAQLELELRLSLAIPLSPSTYAFIEHYGHIIKAEQIFQKFNMSIFFCKERCLFIYYTYIFKTYRVFH
jgi:hypothetical protein